MRAPPSEDYRVSDATLHRAAFRRLHASGCFVLPNPWDVGTTPSASPLAPMRRMGVRRICSFIRRAGAALRPVAEARLGSRGKEFSSNRDRDVGESLAGSAGNASDVPPWDAPPRD